MASVAGESADGARGGEPVLEQCFGEGLVATRERFWLAGRDAVASGIARLAGACEFVESGWDMKQMLRLIVTSATYRQSSAPTPDLLQRDPENRLLARGPRFRLSGEMIRDQALAVSGLLVNRLADRP